MVGRPGRPRAEDADKGLTTGEVAKQLNCSRGTVDRLRKRGKLPARRDGSGKFRFLPEDVVAAGRSLGRPVRNTGAVAQKLYGYFLTPGFRGTSKDLARVVHETGEDPDVVVSFWHKFRVGAGTPEADEKAREIERIASEYDEQIKAMDEDIARKRRAVFITAGDDAPPPTQR